ncbi:MAG: stage II sporulation protein D, partial [Clostridiales bacterium]|nr:stage II sporulation protein D [Clostridiales bacterium]
MKKALLSAVFLCMCMLLIPLLTCMGGEKMPSFDDPDSSDRFILLDEATGKTIEVTAFEYMLGAVSCEMPPSFHSEALKAQAAAAYTIAARARETQRQSPDESLKGACLTVNSDLFQGFSTKEKLMERWGSSAETALARMTEAVKAVEGKVITYQNKPILAAYHAISPGKTETSELYWGQSVDYLTCVESPGDDLAPDYQTQQPVSDDEMKAALLKKFPDLTLPENPSEWFGEPEKSESGTVLSIPVAGQKLSGREIRQMFSLRSACFDLTHDGSGFQFTVRGYGHGVGMSQYGADYMARQGSKWQDIISHYYPGTQIVST